MIRFSPDNLADVFLRPLDMISPEGNVYVEVPAPDLRLALVLLLGIAVLACGRRAQGDRRPALVLLLLTVAAMVPWLATSGNGRYFTPFLLLLGPLCVGLVRLLPVTRAMKFATLGLALLVQGLLVAEASPWGNWSLSTWREGSYFAIDDPPAQPRSYVTLSTISYSLIAPQFPSESRWLHLGTPVRGERERAYAHQWLAGATSLHLVAPSIPSRMEADGQPNQDIIRAFNRIINPRGLWVDEHVRCEFLHSTGLAGLAARHRRLDDLKDLSRFGFWLCPITYEPGKFEAPAVQEDTELNRVFEAVEALCPRFFRPGEADTRRIEGGAVRNYRASDTRLYVLDDGEVLYKFWRSLNPVTIGRREDVLAGRVELDCDSIRAGTWRKGGP